MPEKHQTSRWQKPLEVQIAELGIRTSEASPWSDEPCDEPPTPPASPLEGLVVHVGPIAELFAQAAQNKARELRLQLQEILLEKISARVEKLEAQRSIVVPINTFVPEPYELAKPIFVSVHAVEDVFEAGWIDANIHSTGENEVEAVSNLKSLILDIFDDLSAESMEKLGPEPSRQLAILKQYIQKKP